MQEWLKGDCAQWLTWNMQVQRSRDNESTMFGCIVQMQMHVKVVQIIAETLGFSERPSRLGSHNQPNIFYGDEYMDGIFINCTSMFKYH